MTTENNSLYCKETYEIYKPYTDMIIKKINVVRESNLKIFSTLTKEQAVDFIIDKLRKNVKIKNNLYSISQTYGNEIFLKTQIGEKNLSNSITFLFTENDKSVFLLSYVAFEFNFNNKIDFLYEIEKDDIKIRLTDMENGFKINIFDSVKNDPMFFTTVPDSISGFLPNIEYYMPVHYHNKNKDLPYNNIFIKDNNQLKLNINIFSKEFMDVHLMTYDYDLYKYSDISLDLKNLQIPFETVNNKLKKEKKSVKL